MSHYSEGFWSIVALIALWFLWGISARLRGIAASLMMLSDEHRKLVHEISLLRIAADTIKNQKERK